MVVWNANFEANPEDADVANYGATEIRNLKVAIRERMELEHNFMANSQPFHKPGMCTVVYVGNTAEIAGLANSANGCIAWDSTLKSFKVFQSNAWTRCDPIPSGTKMVFVQSSAPVGWTLDTIHNDRLLMVNSSNGGNTGGTWSLTGISTNASGNHTHGYGTTQAAGGSGTPALVTSIAANGNHSHTLEGNTWRPAYVDCIICTKD